MQKEGLESHSVRETEGLSKFISNEKKGKIEEEKNESLKLSNSQALKLYVDNRENNDLLKELFSIKELKIET